MNEGAVSPDFCFPLQTGRAWGNNDIPWRVEPARQSATWLDEQSKVLRVNLEQAQSRLSKFQQEKGIVVSDERLDQETARYNALITQLALAQTEQVDTSTRRRNSGSDQSPEVLQSASVQSLKSQVAKRICSGPGLG